jgi:hypothetical protein
MKFEDWWLQYGPELGVSKAQAIVIWVAGREALMQELAGKFGIKLPTRNFIQKQ